jgi:hypothetical protein
VQRPPTPTRGRPQPVNDRGLAWNWFSYFLISFLAGGLYCLIVFVRYTHGILWAGPTSPIFLGKCIVVWISHAGCNYGGNCGYWYEGHLEHHNNFRWILFSPFLFSSKQVESEAAMPGFQLFCVYFQPTETSMVQNQCVALHPICRVHRLLRHLSQWWFWAVTWMENWIRKSVHQELQCCNHFCLKIKCGSSYEAFISEIRPIIKYLVFLSSGFVCSLQSRFGSFNFGITLHCWLPKPSLLTGNPINY